MSEIFCPICKAGGCMNFQKAKPPYSVYLCQACDFAFVQPVPDLKQLTEAYNQEGYYAEWVSSQAKARKAMWQSRAKRVLGGMKPGQLLDVGCGEGSFLYAAQQLGWKVRGTEVSASGCRMAKEQWQIGVYNGALEAAQFSPDEFDVVTLWHVIEHVPDPLATMKEVIRITRPGGRIVVACPNRHSHFFNAAYRLGRGRAPHLFDPSDKELHLSHFTVRSLERLIKEAGLVIEQFDVDRGHVQWFHQALDLISVVWFRFTGLFWPSAMEWWLTKPMAKQGAANA